MTTLGELLSTFGVDGSAPELDLPVVDDGEGALTVAVVPSLEVQGLKQGAAVSTLKKRLAGSLRGHAILNAKILAVLDVLEPTDVAPPPPPEPEPVVDEVPELPPAEPTPA